LTKYTPNLTSDLNFGNNGVVGLNGFGGIENLLLQPDGKILGSWNNEVFRFNANGSLDNSFGDGGRAPVGFAVGKILRQANGKIIAGGTLNENFALARINENGTPDLTFGTGGLTETDFGGPEGIHQLAISANRIYAFGSNSLTNILAAYNLNTTCTPPTFLNTLPIVGHATCGQNDGQISIIPQSGVAPYQYSINGGVTYTSGPAVGYTFFNLAPGAYQLKLKDANGCESANIQRSVSSRYGVPTFLNTLPIVGNATCNLSDGQISIIPTSGKGPFMYSINGGATYVAGPNVGYTFFNLPAGTYQLRLKTTSGCETDVVTREVKKINCLLPTPTIAGISKGIAFDKNMNDGKLQIAAYPNPSKGRFTLQVMQAILGKGELSIFDSKGTLVQKANIIIGKGNTVRVNLAGNAPGMYYLKVVSQVGTSTSKTLLQ
jgi:hypothetical protein